MKFKKVVIIGMGLIGGSIGKALIKRAIAEEVVGVCRRESSLDRAVKQRSLTKGFVNDYEKALPGADVVIIATPVKTVKTVLKDISGVISGAGALVTDVGSTKKEIVEYAKKFKDDFSFVGAHPLAGSEKTGVEHSSAEIFTGSLCVLTRNGSTPPQALERIKGLWEAMGARVNVITPDEHDEVLSMVSHLPHMVAYALAGTLQKKDAAYAASGFKDTTRIASSDPLLWSDIFLSNRENVLKSVEKFKRILAGLEKDIKDNNKAGLEDKLKACKGSRNGMF